jgi:glycosyltransferase involved in cell wall biosynthesis
VYNGVDLNVYNPGGSLERPSDHFRVLMVEGSLMGGYEMGLEVALQLVEQLAADQQQEPRDMVELLVVGRVAPEVRERWDGRISRTSANSNLLLTWQGEVQQERIPEIDRSAHVLYSADVNAACPNSVIEALACGLPVIAFDTGALSELVAEDCGRVVPYGGDPWRLEPPDVQALVSATQEILNNQETFRRGARARAESLFGLDEMVEKYLKVLLDT